MKTSKIRKGIRNPDHISYLEAAALTGLSTRTVMRNVAAGKFPCPFKENPCSASTGRLLFSRAAVLEWVRVHRGAE